jgi:integrase
MGVYRRRDSQFYWLSYKVNGRRINESTKTENRKLAEKIYAKRVTEIIEGKWFGFEARKRTLREMIARYEAEYTSKKKHQARDRSIFKHLKFYFGEDIFLQDIEKNIGEYEDYRTSKGAMPATIVKELGLFKRIFNLAIKKWRWVKENPISLVEMPQVKNERVRYLSTDEYNRLLNALKNEGIPKWLRPIVVIALNTGLRESNLLNMKWSWVNLFSRLIIIESTQMKNKENIGIPLTQEAVKTLKELQKIKQIEDFVFHDNGERIYPVKLQRAFKKACDIAGVKDFRFHDLRHTFASYLRQRKIDLHVISRLLGHKDIRMTQRYAHLSVEDLREAISVLNKKENGYVFATFEK